MNLEIDRPGFGGRKPRGEGLATKKGFGTRYLKEIEELKLPFAPAYSRKADEKKVYVQDRLAEMGPKVQEVRRGWPR